jgi:hypothetical protein
MKRERRWLKVVRSTKYQVRSRLRCVPAVGRQETRSADFIVLGTMYHVPSTRYKVGKEPRGKKRDLIILGTK